MSLFSALASAIQQQNDDEPSIRISCSSKWEQKIVKKHLKSAHEECEIERERREDFDKYWSSLTAEQKQTITSVAEGMVSQR